MKTETIIDKLKAHIVDECKTIDREARFDDMLDEIYSFEKVGGPFEHMSPSRVLKEVDPVAYRCGVNDYEDGEEWIEIGGDYYEQDDTEKARQEFVEELESQISDLETEIEKTEADEDSNESKLAEQKRKLAELQIDLQTVEKHSF